MKMQSQLGKHRNGGNVDKNDAWVVNDCYSNKGSAVKEFLKDIMKNGLPLCEVIQSGCFVKY